MLPSPTDTSNPEIWLTGNNQVGQYLPGSPFAQHRGRGRISNHFSVPERSGKGER